MMLMAIGLGLFIDMLGEEPFNRTGIIKLLIILCFVGGLVVLLAR